MRRFLASLCAAALMIGLATPATASPTPKIKRFILDGSNIEGALITPDGKWLFARPTPKIGTLIEYRIDFVDNMVKLTEDL